MRGLRPRSLRWRSVVPLAAAAALVAACGGGDSATDEAADDQPAADEEADSSDDGGDSADGGGEEITLSYAFFAPEVTFPGVQMQEWADELNARTETEVTVELYAGGTLLGAGDIYDGVTQGVADVGIDSPAYDVGRFPLSAAVALPIGFENSQAASHAMFDLLEEFQPEEFAGYEIITAFTTEPAHLQTVEPVTSRDDLQGMELRSAGAGVPALQMLGAAPVGMPMPDVVESLQTGVIEGYMSSREVLEDFQLAGDVGYVTDYAFGISNTFVSVMDQERFDALPEDVKSAIGELKREMTSFASQYHDEENVGSALEWAAEEHGVETVELSDAERGAWDDTLQGLIEDWRQEAGDSGIDADAVLERLYELRDQYNEEFAS